MRARGRRVPDGRLRPAALIDTLKVVLLAAVAIYAAIAALLWFVQDALLFPAPRATGSAQAPHGWRLEPVAWTAADGITLHGLLVKPPGPPAPLVVYFGGNAEEVTWQAAEADRFHGPRALLLVNYRGYGRNAGKPSQQALVADGIGLVDAMRGRHDVDGARLALHGRSLGAGVAVQVAAAREVRCVVLTSPFSSARALAQELYPWLPVGWLLRHPFASIDLAPRIKAPALVLAGSGDSLIPPRHSRMLAEAWGGPAELRELPASGHNDLHLHGDYAGTIRGFLDRCL